MPKFPIIFQIGVKHIITWLSLKMTCKFLLIYESFDPLRSTSSSTICEMLGLEILAAIAGIVSAVNASLPTLKGWIQNIQARRNDENRRLEDSLVRVGRDIQGEFNKDFALLGEMFAKGDGKIEPRM